MKATLPGIIIAMLIGVPMILFGGIAIRLRDSGRALARLISWLTRTAASSLMVGLVAAVLAEYSGLDATATGIVAGFLSLPMTLLVTRPRRSGEEARSSAPVAQKAETIHNETSKPLHSTPSKTSGWIWLRRRTHNSIADEALDKAWAVAGLLADWAPSRLSAVRTSCAALLREFDRAPLNMEAKELEVLIRRRIPELISACAQECRDATPSERESLVEDLLDSLEGVGAEADRYRKQVRRSRGTPFDVLRAHVKNRVTKEGWL